MLNIKTHTDMETLKNKKFYAHKGNSEDNAFQVNPDGNYNRTFMAFNSEIERAEYRDTLWKESNKTKNLIDCTYQFVQQHMSKDFFIDETRHIWINKQIYEGDMAYNS